MTHSIFSVILQSESEGSLMKKFLLIFSCVLLAGFAIACTGDEIQDSSFANIQAEENVVTVLDPVSDFSSGARIDVVVDSENNVTCWVAREIYDRGVGVGISCIPNDLLNPE